MKKLIIGAALVASMLATPAKAEWWVQVIPKSEGIEALYADMDSYDDSVEDTALMVVGYEDNNKQKKMIMGVSFKSCLEQGSGDLIVSDMDGTNTHTGSWHGSGKLVDDKIGEFICGVTRSVAKGH